MDKFKEIRPIVLGLVRSGNKLLVSRGYDKFKNKELILYPEQIFKYLV